MLELVLTEAFARARRKITKAYQFSESDIDRAIDEIAAAPDAHPVYPGFAPHTLRKCRVAMRAYKIPERKGLRLIYLVGKSALAPIHIYKKGHPPKEHYGCFGDQGSASSGHRRIESTAFGIALPL